MTDIVERLRDKLPMVHDGEGMIVDDDAVLDTLSKAADEIEQLRATFTEMREDLIYLNKMCMTLMSLLPPETTPADVRAAMERQGSHVREEKRIITDV